MEDVAAVPVLLPLPIASVVSVSTPSNWLSSIVVMLDAENDSLSERFNALLETV